MEYQFITTKRKRKKLDVISRVIRFQFFYRVQAGPSWFRVDFNGFRTKRSEQKKSDLNKLKNYELNIIYLSVKQKPV